MADRNKNEREKRERERERERERRMGHSSRGWRENGLARAESWLIDNYIYLLLSFICLHLL